MFVGSLAAKACRIAQILTRYNEIGLEGLTDRSRRPYRHANQLPFQIETRIVRLKQDKPSWGAPKIREKLARLYPDVHTPAISTVHAVLDRHGLVKRRMRRRNRAKGTALSLAGQPNDLWCADYKGEFMLADRRYCYPLTITDFASRYLFACEALSTTKEAYAFQVFEAVFKEFGLPKAIRTDNGVPFASPNALFGLSRLSVWWLRLGIEIERIKPGHPQQNGRHERMHLTLKLETTKPAAKNFLQQQAKFDDFIDCFYRASEHPSVYVIEGKRLCWSRCDPVGYFGFCRARSVMAWAADVVRAARAKIQGPSGKGWMASISPVSAANLRVFGAIRMSRAALVRLSQGSFSSAAGLCTGMR